MYNNNVLTIICMKYCSLICKIFLLSGVKLLRL